MAKGNLAERFQKRVGPQLPNGCMEWQSHCYRNGYGVFGYAKRGRVLAHRLAYTLVHGEIPEGMIVMHSCDNPKCVNPEHLSLGTQRDNMADAKTKGRLKRSKLLPYLQNIREMDAVGITQQYISEKYGVSRALISMLLNGQLLNLQGALHGR